MIEGMNNLVNTINMFKCKLSEYIKKTAPEEQRLFHVFLQEVSDTLIQKLKDYVDEIDFQNDGLPYSLVVSTGYLLQMQSYIDWYQYVTDNFGKVYNTEDIKNKIKAGLKKDYLSEDVCHIAVEGEPRYWRIRMDILWHLSDIKELFGNES